MFTERTPRRVALYRIVELSSGSIILDGVDISKVGLADLRNALAIIPQDPVSEDGLLYISTMPNTCFDSFYVRAMLSLQFDCFS